MLTRLYLITFIECVATVLVERGIYFYTHAHLAFTDVMNLSVAMSLGLAYVGGALVSGPVCSLIGQKQQLRLALAGQVLGHAMIIWVPSIAMVYPAVVSIGFFNGLKWPAIETYIGGGAPEQASAGVIGLFNITWSTSACLALWATGPLLALPVPTAWLAPGAPLFIVAGGINLLSLLLLKPLGNRPLFVLQNDCNRPTPAYTTRLAALLASSRWSMLSAFCLLAVVAPLMPQILTTRLGLPLVWAAPFSSLIDVVRVATFVLLWRSSAWQNCAALLALVAFAAPIGFFLIVTAGSLVVVLAGQIILGAAIGLAYHSALYNAIVLKHASVTAGSKHEGVIGISFFLGPLVGLIGSRLVGLLGSTALGMLAGVGPLIVICLAGAIWPLWHGGRKTSHGDSLIGH